MFFLRASPALRHAPDCDGTPGTWRIVLPAPKCGKSWAKTASLPFSQSLSSHERLRVGTKLGYSPNVLLEGIDTQRIDQVWVGDITYIPLSSVFAYLAMIMDLHSRKIIGWSLHLSMEEPLVIAAFTQAIKARQPIQGLIHHTDRGGQYAGKKYRKMLARAQMIQSMSRAGDCYDNAFMESCFGTIKTELEMTTYDCFEKACKEIKEYINYYNVLRRHSAIDYLSPTSFEETLRH